MPISDAYKSNAYKTMSIIQRKIPTNGLQYHTAQAGQGPLVLLLHGFPESWYSWRHQILFLAEHGYHAVAPDMRGYGEQKITQPAMFVVGDRDPVMGINQTALKKMPQFVPNLVVNEKIEGVGHWTQYEKPEQFNKILLRFLQQL